MHSLAEFSVHGSPPVLLFTRERYFGDRFFFFVFDLSAEIRPSILVVALIDSTDRSVQFKESLFKPRRGSKDGDGALIPETDAGGAGNVGGDSDL